MYNVTFSLSDEAVLRNIVSGLSIPTQYIDPAPIHDKYICIVDQVDGVSNIIHSNLYILSENDMDDVVLRVYDVNKNIWYSFKEVLDKTINVNNIPKGCSLVRVLSSKDETLFHRHNLFMTILPNLDMELFLEVTVLPEGHIKPILNTFDVKTFTIDVDANTPLVVDLINGDELRFIRKCRLKENYPYHHVIPVTNLCVKNKENSCIVYGTDFILLKRKYTDIKNINTKGLRIE